MARNGKAEATNFGSKEKHLTGKSKRFLCSDYKHFSCAIQCKYCGSDYMRFAVDGFCQRCQQRAEYLIREGLTSLERAKARGAAK